MPVGAPGLGAGVMLEAAAVRRRCPVVSVTVVSAAVMSAAARGQISRPIVCSAVSGIKAEITVVLLN